MALGRGLSAILEEVSLAYEQNINKSDQLSSDIHDSVVSEKQQKKVIDIIISQKLTVRQIEDLVKYIKKEEHSKIKKVTKKEPWIESYRQEIKEFLPFSHKLKDNKIEIAFKNSEELMKFIEIIKKT